MSQLAIDADEMLWHAWRWKSHCYMVKFRFTTLYGNQRWDRSRFVPKLVSEYQVTVWLLRRKYSLYLSRVGKTGSPVFPSWIACHQMDKISSEFLTRHYVEEEINAIISVIRFPSNFIEKVIASKSLGRFFIIIQHDIDKQRVRWGNKN